MSKTNQKAKPKSIAIVVNQNEILYRLRMPWIRFFKEHRFRVFAVAPSGSWNKLIEANGAKHIEWKLSRSGRNPFKEFHSVLSLRNILHRIKPDIVQNFHTKPNIYAPIAAKLAGVPITVSTVTGLGYTFVDRPGFSSKLEKKLNLRLYAFSNRQAREVTFQNSSDLELLRNAGTLPHSKGRLIPGGSGIDLTEYYPQTSDSSESLLMRKQLGIPSNNFVVMFVGRLQLDKGIVEFVQAARNLNKQRKDISFVMVGAPDPGNKRTITEATLKQWNSEKDVIFTGRREDVPKLMAIANTITTPTFYCEGLPRTLLEAAASGLPLIGTDIPGVRDAISPGVNGILIPTRDSNALAKAIQDLADNPRKAERYGNASLNRAKMEFDHRRVVGEYLKLYEELWAKL